MNKTISLSATSPIAFLGFIIFLLFVLEGEKEIIIPALPLIKDHFNASYVLTQALVYLNLFGFCGSCLVSGYLIENWGHEKVFQRFSWLLVFASIASTATFSLNLMVAARFLQGLASAVLFSAVYSSVGSSFTPERNALYLGIINGFLCLALGIAPMLGAYIVEQHSWQLAIYTITLLSILNLIYVYATDFSLVHDSLNKQTLLASLNEVRLVAFTHSFLLPASISSAMLAIYIGFITLSPYLILADFGLSSLHYGLNQGLALAAFSIASLIAPRVFSHFGMQKVKDLSLKFLAILGLIILLVMVSPLRSYPVFVFFSTVYFFAQGILYSQFLSESVNCIPGKEAYASSLGVFCRHGVSAISIYLSSILTGDFLLSSFIMIAFWSVIAYFFFAPSKG